MPSSFVYQGQIIKNNGQPLNTPTVFTIQILSPGSERCVLYEEKHLLNMAGSEGVFSLSIGNGVRSGTNFEDVSQIVSVFQNTSTFAGLSECLDGISDSYSPSGPYDRRKLRVTYNDGSGNVLVPIDYNVQSVPFAWEARTLLGRGPQDFIQARSFHNVTQDNLEDLLRGSNYLNLLNLAQGSSTQYVGAGSNGAHIPSYAADPGAPIAGSMWLNTTSGEMKYFNGSTVQVAGAGGGGGGGGPLVEADIPTLSSSGKVVGTAITSGQIGGTTSMNTSGNLITTGNIGADEANVDTVNAASVVTATMSSTAASARNLDIYDSDNTNYVRLQAPTTGDLTSNYNLTLPTTAGTNGFVLQTNGSGVLSWVENVPDDSITTDKIQDGAVTDAKIDSVLVSKVSNALGQYFNYMPDGGACGVGQVLKWSTMPQGWMCGDDDGGVGTISAINTNMGSALAGGGNSGALDLSVVTDNTSIGVSGNALEVLDGGVSTAKLADASVTNAKLAASSVNTTQLVDGAVTTLKLADGAITNAKLANDSVSTSQIVNGAVTNDKITSVSVDKITSALGQYFGYAPNGTACADGQVLKWNDADTRWECGSDNDTNTDAVSSVFGRNGVVVAEAGDYTATQVTNTPAGNIAATNVQAALNELDAEKFNTTGGTISGNVLVQGAITSETSITLNNQTEIRFADSDSGNYVALRAPATVGSNITWTLPAADGTSGQVLSTDGSGVLAWTNASAGSVTEVATGSGLTGGPINSTGTIAIATGGVTSSHIADGTIATEDLSDAVVTSAKLADGAITTDKVQDAAITDAKIHQMSVNKITSALGQHLTYMPDGGACTVGQTLKWQLLPVAGWICADDEQGLGADNLGNHLAEQNLDLGSHLLVGNGGASGLAITADGNVGLGTASPSVRLEVSGNLLVNNSAVSSMSSTGSFIRQTYYSDNASSRGQVVVERHRGTSSAPEAVQIGDRLGTFGFSGYSGTGLRQASGFDAVVDGAVTDTTVPTQIQILTGSNTGTRAPRLSVGSTGLVGIGTTTPTVSLDVSGHSDAIRLPAGADGARPGTPANGMIRYNTTSNKFEAYENGAWTNMISTGVTAGGIGTTELADGSVTTAKLANGAVTTLKMADASVTSAKIGADAVTTSQILNGTILDEDIANATITGGKLVNSTITATQLADGAVTSAKILDGTIVNADIANTTITGAKLVNSTITATQIANTTITGAKMVNGTVGTTQLADAGVTDAKINSVSVNKITNALGQYFNYLPNNGACAVGQTLKWSSAPQGWVCGNDDNSGDVLIGGNTVSSAMTIGTNSNHSLELETNGTTKMTILSNGNVGIGTASPGNQIHVTGATNAGITLQSADDQSRLLFSNNDGSDYASIGYHTSGLALSGAGTPVANPHLYVSNSGSIGIGTVNPQKNLHIMSPQADSVLIERTGAFNAAVQYKNTVGSMYAGLNSDAHWGVGTTANLDSTGILTVHSSGAVGVRTNNPITPLDVFGPVAGGEAASSSATPNGILALRSAGTNIIATMGVQASTTPQYFWIQPRHLTNTTNYNTVLNPNGGSVGIGNTTPSYPLHISGTTGVGANLLALTDTTNSQTLALGANPSGVSINNLQNNALRLGANNLEHVRINPSGLVNIGVSGAGQMDVNGTIRMRPAASNHVYMEIYARTATPDTRSGWIGYGSSGTNLLSITNEIASGNINLGTSGGRVGVNNTSPSYTLDVSGSVAGTSAYVNTSDVRLKKDIQVLENPLDMILKIHGVRYNWRSDEFPDYSFDQGPDVGVIAQEVEKVLPEAVKENSKGMKSVAYSKLIAPLIESVKELYYRLLKLDLKSQVYEREIASLKKQNQVKDEKIESLEKRLERLEKQFSGSANQKP